MNLEAGTVLGHYRLAGRIGVGGMGEVWRGTDTTLGREVAIKILPAAFASDPERLARFEREAKVLASLNHPNIATIHGFHEADGVPFLAMELVPGEDLAGRLKLGRLPVAEALDIARQTAEALEAAHEHGVVHRDLKPANVKLTEDGRVKVLDFGLAKAAERTAASGDSGASPTITSLGTVAGMILGTAAYMSPEQARGKAVDKRADVWAFGCLLFEMLSGKRPFEGETISDTLAAVLAKDPDWSALPAATPARVRELMARCLEKDAKRRLRDIGEARIELENALAGRTTPGQPTPVLRRAFPLALFMTGVAVVATGLALWALMKPAQAVAPARLARLGVERPLGERLNGPGTFALAPDGGAIVFTIAGGTDTPRLWIRELGDTDGRELSGTGQATFPFWSPDSRHIAFFADGKLMRVPRAGGAVRTVCEAGNGRGGAWGPGVIVFAASPFGALSKVAADGGVPAPATKLDEARKHDSHRFPSFLPDGRHFVYATHPEVQPGLMQADVASLDDPIGRPLLLTGSAPRYAPPGYMIFVRDQALVAQRIDLGTLEMTGEILPLADRAEAFPRVSGTPAVDADVAGTLVYDDVDRRATDGSWVARDGRPLGRAFLHPGPVAFAAMSARGDRVGLMEFGDGEISIVAVDLARGTSSRVVRAAQRPRGIAWSPSDGRIVAMLHAQSDTSAIVSIDPHGGAERAIASLPGKFTFPTSVAPDGTIVLTDLMTGRLRDVVSLPPGEGGALKTYLGTTADEQDGAVSPDGRLIAYTSNVSGRTELYVDSFPELREARRVSHDGAVGLPAWRSDGRELYFSGADGRSYLASDVAASPGLTVGKPRVLFSIPADTRAVLPSPEGDKFLVLTPAGERRTALTLVQNWSAQLENPR